MDPWFVVLVRFADIEAAGQKKDAEFERRLKQASSQTLHG